jgi:hypothetical protein
MRINVQRRGPAIARQVLDPIANHNIPRRVIYRRRVACRQPVLGPCVSVPEQERWQARNGIIHVRDPELGAQRWRRRCLRVGKVGKGVVADPRTSVTVRVDGHTGRTQGGAGQRGEGTAETMACRHDAVRGIRGLGGRDAGQGRVLHFVPGIEEARVHLAVCAEGIVGWEGIKAGRRPG